MRLYVMQFSLNPATGSPVPGYLIQTDDGTNILVDTGFPEEYVEMYTRPDAQASWRVEREDFVINRLAAIGVKPEDVHYLVATHLDVDHAGAHDRFPNAEIVVQQLHYETAKTHSRFDTMRAHWDAPGLNYRTVEGDTELVPGVELIESSGHVPGHQSVLVRLPTTGPVLLTIDAINHAGQRDPATRSIGPYDMDEAGTRASTRKLMDLAAREGVTLIIHGHDPDQWKTLKKSPEYYS